MLGKIIEGEENGGKDRKVLNKLMNSVVYGKNMKNFRNRNDVSQL